MADGGYQRTCTRCQHTWLVPSDIAEERPNVKSITGQFASMIGGSVQDQFALRAHYQQLGAAAKCPQCGATSFTQAKAPESPTSPEPPSAVPSSAPQASPAPDGQPPIYVLNQKLISPTGDLWIEDGQGNHAFEVDGKLLSLRGTHVLKDLGGQALYEISKSLAPHVHKTIAISKGGQTAATVQEAIFHLGGDKFKISLAGGLELTVHGDWMNREFQVRTRLAGWPSLCPEPGSASTTRMESRSRPASRCPSLWRSSSPSSASKPRSRASSHRFRICSVASARSERGAGWCRRPVVTICYICVHGSDRWHCRTASESESLSAARGGRGAVARDRPQSTGRGAWSSTQRRRGPGSTDRRGKDHPPDPSWAASTAVHGSRPPRSEPRTRRDPRRALRRAAVLRGCVGAREARA